MMPIAEKNIYAPLPKGQEIGLEQAATLPTNGDLNYAAPKDRILSLPEKKEETTLDTRLEAIKRQSKHETIIRFAAVELEGSVKKE